MGSKEVPMDKKSIAHSLENQAFKSRNFFLHTFVIFTSFT